MTGVTSASSELATGFRGQQVLLHLAALHAGS